MLSLKGVLQGRFATALAIFIRIIMRLIEIFEAKQKLKTIEPPKPQNFVAKHAQKSGAGKHQDSKSKPPSGRKDKHKNKSFD